jgi:hypothetical protein
MEVALMTPVKVEMLGGRSAAKKQALLDAVHAALEQVWGISRNDRFQRIVEYPLGAFEIPPGHSDQFIVIEITAAGTYSAEQNRRLQTELSGRLEALGIPRKDVMVVIRVLPAEQILAE